MTTLYRNGSARSRRFRHSRAAIAMAFIVACTVGLSACASHKTNAKATNSFETLALSTEKNRDTNLYAAAQKEGSLMVYTSFVVQPVLQGLIKAFESKYPGVKVNYFQATESDLTQHVTSEWSGGKRDFDVVMPSTSAQLIATTIGAPKFTTPFASDYPKSGGLGPNPTGQYTAVAQYPKAFAYNTKLTDPSKVPTDWNGLLDPYWTGKMMWSSQEQITGVAIGGLIGTTGQAATETYLQKLGKQQLKFVDQGASGLLNQVIAGAATGCFCSIHQVIIAKDGGAPVDFSMLGSTYFEETQNVELSPQPPHPNAALLFTDFMLDPQGGQKVLSDNHYFPAYAPLANQVPQLVGKKPYLLTNDVEAKNASDWSDLMKKYLQP